MLMISYGAWASAIALYETLGPIGLIVLAAPAATLHSSLRHEAIHGHPTSSAAVNEALVFPALDLLIPYRRFKETHLRHHRDERLTDPYDDPESWYVAAEDWRRAKPLWRGILTMNATLLGRMILGPWLAAIGLWRADARAALKNAKRAGSLAEAYLRHAAGAALALGAAWALGGVDPATYALCVAWPAVGLLMLRSYIEHRAAASVPERTAIIEAEPFFAALFLNNNLHAAHHRHPSAPWSALPAIWRRERAQILADNGGYLIPGYASVIARWWLRPREPVAHPYADPRRGRPAAPAADAAAPLAEPARPSTQAPSVS